MPQYSLPAPRTWSAGDLVTVPRLRADVANAVAFLANRPVFAGQNQSGQGWGSGTDSGLGIDTELIDNWGGHVVTSSGAALNSEYWAPVPGWYLVQCAPAWSYTSSTQAMFAGGAQGTTGGTAWGPQRGPLVLSGSTHAPQARYVDLIQMSQAGSPGGSGDYVQWTALQTTGSVQNLVANADYAPYVGARWVCAISGTQPLPVPPLTACPSPITHAWLNAGVRDTIEYLIYPPVMRAFYNNTGSSLSSTTFPAGVAVPVNTASVDNYGAFSGHTWTAPIAGRYLVAGQVNLNASTGTTGYCCGISVNGGTTTWGDVTYKVSDTTGGGAGFIRRMRFSAGDTVALMACQGSGSAIAWNTSGINPTRLVTVWEGT